MALEQSDTFNALKVCMKCGWPMAGVREQTEHKSKCEYLRQGRVASELAHRLLLIPSTKFGYGTGQLVFTFEEHFSVRFDCRSNGALKLEGVWLLDSIGPDAAEALVKCLDAWRKEWGETFHGKQVSP